jgi:hypothetical protein
MGYNGTILFPGHHTGNNEVISNLSRVMDGRLCYPWLLLWRYTSAESYDLSKYYSESLYDLKRPRRRFLTEGRFINCIGSDFLLTRESSWQTLENRWTQYILKYEWYHGEYERQLKNEDVHPKTKDIHHLFQAPSLYEGVSKSFQTESITKYMLTTINASWEATQRVTAAKLTRLIHKISIKLHLVAESCTICSSGSRRPVRKLLDTPSYFFVHGMANWECFVTG